MIWKGKELKTITDVMKFGIDACTSKEEAENFMNIYRKENSAADDNIGYLAGYYDRETKHRIFDWFDVEHPIFGRNDPTPEEAFQAGISWAEESRKKNGI